MDVKLIGCTPNPVKTIYAACRTCYSSSSPDAILKTLPTDAKMKALIRRVVSHGHTSVLEHVSLSFSISRISRACSHQLVRHRIASYSQQSQRHVRSGGDYVMPPSIGRRKRGASVFTETVDTVYRNYRKLLDMGIPKEDARYLLPNGQTTNLVMTMDLRELIHAASLRLCSKSQWEIRLLFQKLKREIARKERFISSLLLPECKRLGYCPEEESCGLTPKR